MLIRLLRSAEQVPSVTTHRSASGFYEIPACCFSSSGVQLTVFSWIQQVNPKRGRRRVSTREFGGLKSSVSTLRLTARTRSDGSKSTLIYGRGSRTFEASKLLLDHTKLESTVRYLVIEVDDALEIAEQTEV